MAKKTPRPVRTLRHFRAGDRRALRAGRARRDLEAPARPGPRGRHPDHPVGDRRGRRRHPDQAQAGGRHRRRARQRQRRLRGRGVHPGKPQHHRRDPGREPLRPRERGQAHRAAAVPAGRRPAAAGHPRDAAQGLGPVRARRPARPARPTPRRRPSNPRSARPPRNHAPHRSPTPRPRLRHRATGRPSQAPVDPTQQQPQITQKGAPVDKPLQWAQDPGVEWMQKFAKFTCPPKGENVGPEVGQPRRAADRVQRRGPEVPALRCADRGHRAEVGVVRHAAAGRRAGRSTSASRAPHARSSGTPPRR